MKSTKQKITYQILDLILSTVSIYSFMLLFLPADKWHNRYLIIGAIGGLIFITIAKIRKVYFNINYQNIYEISIQIFKIWIFIGATLVVISFLLKDIENLARHVSIAWVLITPFLLIFYRIVINVITTPIKKIFLVIDKQYVFTSYELQRLKKLNIKLSYCTSDIANIKQSLVNNKIDNIIVNQQNISNELIQFITKKNITGLSYTTIENFMEKNLRKCYIPYDLHSLNYLDEIKSYNSQKRIIKTIIDFTVSPAIAILSLPIMLFSIFKIKQESPGKVLFKQKRVGKSGVEFTLRKFRSMSLDAEQNGARYAEKDDPRVYKFGKFMRKSRIDELPQIINVLKGDIHLIGPRAERLIFTQQLEQKIPYYQERHIVKPGITGWAQVNYPYGSNIEDTRQKLMYDLYYIKNWSLALEIEVIFKTIKVVLKRQGM